MLTVRKSQDASLFATVLDGRDRVSHALLPGRQAYVQVARGSVSANGVALQAGDAVHVADEAAVALGEAVDAEVLLFDLPE